MTDVVDCAKRSLMMSGIKNKNTKPELLIRSFLHRRGFRYRLHSSKLPGKPDIVLKKYNAIIFIHGCFWHGHGCRLFKWPKSRSNFWKLKIEYNKQNDRNVMLKLFKLNYRVCVIWECSIKGASKELLAVFTKLSDWLCSDSKFLEITS